MDEGDILHYILIVDGGVTPTVGLTSIVASDNQNEPPDAVVALDASDITDSSFTANWYFIENATAYYLDVATDSDFTSFVAGYEDLSVGAVNEYSVTGLTDAYTYYYRLRAINDNGTGDSSNTITLTTLNETVVDGDGNIYTYVTIGTQQWLVENLITTKYIDGTAIPNLTLDADWQAEDGTVGHDGAYCWYDNDEATYKEDYGALYNWYAVNNAHGIAPTGWRVPSDADWSTLGSYLGDELTAGGELKKIGLTYWDTPNTGASDDYGFGFVGGGERSATTGAFSKINEEGSLFKSDNFGPTDAGYIQAYYDSVLLYGLVLALPTDKRFGFNIRCMRDI